MSSLSPITGTHTHRCFFIPNKPFYSKIKQHLCTEAEKFQQQQQQQKNKTKKKHFLVQFSEF